MSHERQQPYLWMGMTLPAPKKAASASLLKQMSCVHAVQRTCRGKQQDIRRRVMSHA